ncbi:IS110 family transposase, partial [Pseudomonas graminis]|nr:IS110 family transposase [Pseudomonas graminis]
GMKILRAIIAGERDPSVLADLTDRRIKASKETVARSLHGNWRLEHLHALEQEVQCYDFFEQQIGACDKAIMGALSQLPEREEAPQPSRKILRSPHRCAADQA